MNKSVSFDLSADRLVQTAENLIDSRDYLGALKILNKNAERNGDEAYVHMLYAQIFDDLGLYERSVNEWFKFIALSDDLDEEDLFDAYEGLAVGFMNLGDEHFSAFYYDKVLSLSGEEIPDEMRKDILGGFLHEIKNPLKFVYPPELADYSEVLSKGVDFIKSNEFDKALKEFEKVDRRNKAYAPARNLMAMTYMLSDRADVAEQECFKILELFPDDIQALATLAAVKTEQGKREESKEYAKKILRLKPKNNDELFKIATVCCENGMHEEAYGLFLKLEEENPYDSSVLFFTAVSAYNCGKYEKCLTVFDKMLILNPYAVTAEYFRQKIKIAVRKNEKIDIGYFYRLPQSERESTLKILAATVSLPDSHIKEMSEAVDLTQCIRWCFDESEGTGNTELKTLGAICASLTGHDDIVSDFLLNAFIEDNAKIKVLTELGERNNDAEWNIVFCNMNKSVRFYRLQLPRTKKKLFVDSYAYLAAHFGIFGEKISLGFASACNRLYNKLEAEDKLKSLKNRSELSAAIFLDAGVKLPRLKKREDILKFFNADGKKILEFYGV